MGASQRRKGAAAERELAKILADELGERVCRNLEQVRSGGCDLLGLAPFAIEVKRCETLALPAWWRQACEQSQGAVPVLAYRRSRQPWRFRLPLPYVQAGDWGALDPVCEVDLFGFCWLAREVVSDVD